MVSRTIVRVDEAGVEVPHAWWRGALFAVDPPTPSVGDYEVVVDRTSGCIRLVLAQPRPEDRIVDVHELIPSSPGLTGEA